MSKTLTELRKAELKQWLREQAEHRIDRLNEDINNDFYVHTEDETEYLNSLDVALAVTEKR